MGLEGKRRIVKAMLKQTPAGGTLAAVVRCCDHAEELARRLVLSGTPAEELGLINLTNKEIAALKPTLAEYLVSFNTYRAAKWPEESNPSLAFTRHVIGNYDFSDMRCTLDDGFKVSFVQVGLIWRNEAKAR